VKHDYKIMHATIKYPASNGMEPQTQDFETKSIYIHIFGNFLLVMPQHFKKLLSTHYLKGP